MTSPEGDAIAHNSIAALLAHGQDAGRAGPAAVLDALPAQVAELDARGTIVSVNAAWRAFGAANGLQAPDHAVGQDYLAACEAPVADPGAADWPGAPGDGVRAAAGIRAVLAGEADRFTLEYPCHSPAQERWFELSVAPLPGPAGPGGAVVLHVDVTQRKQLSKRLALLALETERRERMFSTMLSSISDLTYVLDRQGRVLHASDHALRLWGLTLEQAVGRNATEIGYPPELAQHIDDQVRWVFQNGKPVTDETAFVDLEGATRHYEYVFSPAFAPDGSVEFLVGCSREVTERRRAEAALRDSVAEFRTLAAAMPQIVWAGSAIDELTYLNVQWVEYTGRSVEDSLGAGWLASVHPDDFEPLSASLRDALKTGHRSSQEARLLRVDGAYRWWLVRCVPVKDEEGLIVRWIGTCTDIDELKVAEAKVLWANRGLQRQRSELRALFDLVPALVWVRDLEGNVVQINQRAASHLALNVEDAVGRHVTQLFPQPGSEGAREDSEILRTGESVLGKVYRSEAPDGSEIWVHDDKVPYRDGRGSIIGIMVMRHDVTEPKRVQDSLSELNASLEDRVRERTAELALMRDEAQRANEAKSVFLATMSHEIRTPMSGLLGLLELLELSPLDEEQHSILAVARESGRSLQQIIDGILDFAKIEANSLQLALTSASVSEVVEGVCRLHSPIAHGKDLTLACFVAPGIRPCLRFDPLRLGQILNNLVGNAIKFTERGFVNVQVEVAGSTPTHEHLRLTVADTGIGIAPDRIPQLFQPFVQADAGTSTRFGGTGLGLSIARSLAALMDGTLSLESTPGRGTRLTLCVTFEVCESCTRQQLTPSNAGARLDALLASRPRAPSVEEAAARGALLLIVDDHPINRMVLLRQAWTLGYAAEAAADAHQALEALESGRFGALITDCNMPGMSGYELAATIRAREAASGSAALPIIGCTANALASAARACVEAGMDDSMTKPVTLAEICAKLDRWIPLAPAAARPAARGVAPPASAMAAAGGEALLDHDLLGEIAGGDPSALAQILDDLRRNNAADGEALRAAVAGTDFAQAAAAAHRVRGVCAMLGAVQLAEASARAQAAAADGDMHRLRAAMEVFEHEVARLDRYLDSLA